MNNHLLAESAMTFPSGRETTGQGARSGGGGVSLSAESAWVGASASGSGRARGGRGGVIYLQPASDSEIRSTLNDPSTILPATCVGGRRPNRTRQMR